MLKYRLDLDTLVTGDTLLTDFDNCQFGDLSQRQEIWFTVKSDRTKLDSLADIQISESGGLLYINGQPATNSLNGSITVTNVSLGLINVRLEAVETAKITPFCRMYYDLQILFNNGVETRMSGNVPTFPSVTKATV